MKLQTLVLLLILLVIPVSSHAVVFWTDGLDDASNGFGLAVGSGPVQIDQTIKYIGLGSAKYFFDTPLVGSCLPGHPNHIADCGGFWDRGHQLTSNLWRRFMLRLGPGFIAGEPQTKIIKAGADGFSDWLIFGANTGLPMQMTMANQGFPTSGDTRNLWVWPTVLQTDGQWHCIEINQTLNTPGVADGTFYLWVDGVLGAAYTDVGWRRAGDNTQFNYSRLYRQYGSGQMNIDELAVGDTRIGCPGAPPPDTTNPFDVNSITVTPGATFLDISWGSVTDNPSGAVTYVLQMCTGVLCSGFGSDQNVSGTNYTVSALSPNTTMRFRVKAKDSSGNLSTNWSPIGSGTVPAGDTTPPVKPSNLTVR